MVILVFGVFCCSTAVIFIKASTVHPVLLAAVRLIVAGALLLPLFLRDLRSHRGVYTRSHLRRAVVPGLLLAVHFVTWNIGARLTVAANASLIINMMPVVMPFLLYVMIRERLNRGEWTGTALAVAGVVLLGWADLEFSPERFGGDVVTVVSMVIFAAYVASARRNRDVPTVWLYVWPLYVVAGAACLAVSVLAAALLAIPGGEAVVASLGLAGKSHPLAIPTWRDAGYLLALGVIPTIVGHSIINHAMRFLRGQLVSLTNLGQPIFAAVLAYFLLDETPDVWFYPSAALVASGAGVAIWSMPAPTPPRDAPETVASEE
jgi:drug/metabolite transporter (DMT)-like permease